MIKECRTEADFAQILQGSQSRPVMLFKHSTACSTSAVMWEVFTRFAHSESRPEYWRVLAIESRKLSRKIADDTGVTHQSPQVLLFCNGRVVWSASHWEIDEKRLGEALSALSR